MCLLMMHTAFGAVWYVTAGGSGNNSGTSWDNASNDIQYVINQASMGDEIWIAGGEYSGNYELGNKRLRIFGGFEGTETSLLERLYWRDNETVLDGSSNGPVFYMYNNSGSVIDGFTIQNGNGEGAGVRAVASGPVIADCIFQYNSGRAIVMLEGAYPAVSGRPASLINLDFYGNWVENTDYSLDGVVAVYGNTATLYNVTMNSNEGSYDDIAVSANSGDTYVRIYNSIIYDSGELYNTTYFPNSLLLVHSSLIEGCDDSSYWARTNAMDDGWNIDDDPIFTTDRNRLDINSPGIQAADLSYLPNHDFTYYDLDGKSRFNRNTYTMDMGAYENQTGHPELFVAKGVKRTNKPHKSDATLSIYPTQVQPAGSVSVVCEDIEPAWAEIYSITGQLHQIIQLHAGNNQMNMPAASGVYIIIVKADNKVIGQEKIIVMF